MVCDSNSTHGSEVEVILVLKIEKSIWKNLRNLKMAEILIKHGPWVKDYEKT